MSYDYGRYRVHKTGPWVKGGAPTTTGSPEGIHLDALAPTARIVHVVTECSKLAFADREGFYGDPAFSEIPLTSLLSDAYNESAGG